MTFYVKMWNGLDRFVCYNLIIALHIYKRSEPVLQFKEASNWFLCFALEQENKYHSHRLVFTFFYLLHSSDSIQDNQYWSVKRHLFKRSSTVANTSTFSSFQGQQIFVTNNWWSGYWVKYLPKPILVLFNFLLYLSIRAKGIVRWCFYLFLFYFSFSHLNQFLPTSLFWMKLYNQTN